ncbi:hypothetical protein PR048_021431, partial [Dryococelus australis]
MAEGVGYNLIPKLSFEGNVHANWKHFIRHFEVYLDASGKDPDITGKSEAEIKALRKVQARTLLNIAGEEATDVAATLNFTETQMDNYNDLVTAFDSYAATKQNEIYERYIFNQCHQDAGETFEQPLLRDRIVVEIRDHKIREVLLRVEDLSLKQAARDCRA